MVEAAEQSQQQPIRRRAGPKSARRLCVKAVFTGFKRGHRSQHENTSLLKHNGSDASFYLGKRAVSMYRAHKTIARGGGPKTRVRAIWGQENAEQSQQQPIRRRVGPKSSRRLYVQIFFSLLLFCTFFCASDATEMTVTEREAALEGRVKADLYAYGIALIAGYGALIFAGASLILAFAVFAIPIVDRIWKLENESSRQRDMISALKSQADKTESECDRLNFELFKLNKKCAHLPND